MKSLRLSLCPVLILIALCSPAQGNPTHTPDNTPDEAQQMETPQSDLTVNHGVNATQLRENVRGAMEDAIADGSTPGGVVLILRDEKIILHEAYGNRSVAPTTETATIDTVYDLASLTKPIVTATSIMMLVESGRIRLSDPIAKYFPEWKNTPEEQETKDLLERLKKAINLGKIKPGLAQWETADNETADLLATTLTRLPEIDGGDTFKHFFNLLPRDRESITIAHLLTHTSGLPSFIRYYERYPEKNARQKIIKDIATGELRGPAGGQFIYSDLGFIVLGELVERVSGKSLDEFSANWIFRPLGMTDTSFTSSDQLIARIAPTEWRAESAISTREAVRAMIRGEVHDGNAWVQNGISGHAGLFSTAKDLGRFFQMMLNGGQLEGTRILSPATIKTMTQDHANLGPDGPGRGYGWDLTSSFSTQKGDIFTTGYGHTGFTGTSVWVVPEEKLAIIILTNRVHPDGKGDVVPLRAKIANIVAGSLTESYIESVLEN